MNMSPSASRPLYVLAAVGTFAALGPPAWAQSSESSAAATGLRLSEPELWPARTSESRATPDTGLRVASLGEFRLTYQPEDATSAPAVTPPAQGAEDAEHLAKQLANPVADLISVPLQFNFDKGYGPKDADRWTLNIQPVIPFSISEDWNLITRTIVPVIYQESVADGVSSDFGLGDTTQSFFFSPKKPIGGWILGAGPVVLWPTGTDPALRSESLGLGPTLVALRQEHGWTYGVLANQIWSVTNSNDHEQVSNMYLQPFLTYTWPTATTLALNTETSYNWSNEEWTVPINLMLSQLVKFGHQPVQFQIGGRYYADSPAGGPEWGMRFTVTLLFPK